MDAKAEQRVRQLEATLIAHNETTNRILEACRRIQWQWDQRQTTKEHNHEHAD